MRQQTNVHKLNMCPADVAGKEVCVYERVNEGIVGRQEIPEECNYISRRKKGN